jgi:hypothetical protein
MSRQKVQHLNGKVSQLVSVFDDALSVVVGGLSANKLRRFTFCEQDFAVCFDKVSQHVSAVAFGDF